MKIYGSYLEYVQNKWKSDPGFVAVFTSMFGTVAQELYEQGFRVKRVKLSDEVCQIDQICVNCGKHFTAPVHHIVYRFLFRNDRISYTVLDVTVTRFSQGTYHCGCLGSVDELDATTTYYEHLSNHFSQSPELLAILQKIGRDEINSEYSRGKRLFIHRNPDGLIWWFVTSSSMEV